MNNLIGEKRFNEVFLYENSTPESLYLLSSYYRYMYAMSLPIGEIKGLENREGNDNSVLVDNLIREYSNNQGKITDLFKNGILIPDFTPKFKSPTKGQIIEVRENIFPVISCDSSGQELNRFELFQKDKKIDLRILSDTGELTNNSLSSKCKEGISAIAIVPVLIPRDYKGNYMDIVDGQVPKDLKQLSTAVETRMLGGSSVSTILEKQHKYDMGISICYATPCR